MLGRARFGGFSAVLLVGACSQVLGYDEVDFKGSGGAASGGAGATDASAGSGGSGGSLGGAPSGGAAGTSLGGAPSGGAAGAGGAASGGAAGAGGAASGGTAGAGGTLPTGGSGGTTATGGSGGTTSTGGTTATGGSGGTTSTGGSGGTTSTGGSGGTTATGGSGGTTSTGGTGGATGGSGGTGGSCTGGVVEKTITASGSPGGSPIYGAVMPSGDTAIAWMSGGNIYVTRVNAAGTRLGTDYSVPGLHVHGFTATTDGYAMLVARSPDHLYFVKLNTSGAVVVDKDLIGGCNQATIGCEWYSYSSTFAAEGGRLHFKGSGYTAYFPIYRRWPDNIAHTGDTLRHLDLSGNAGTGSVAGWGWGCSHSLDLRLAQNGTTVGPVCLSDCYASKSILWADSKVISSEPSGNCAGTSGAALGGFVSVSGGYWLSYVSPEGRPNKDIAVAKLDTAGNVSTKVWLTSNSVDDDSAHLVAFKGGLLAAWRTGTTRTLQELDITTGNPVGAPVTTTSAFRAKDDFFAYPNGDAGWVYASGANLILARYSKCP
ncbi:MAG: hypothetical protein KJ015_04365 [Myxococcales bacterium]|nr:hypothetical protein [Myxococcales bacterium]